MKKIKKGDIIMVDAGFDIELGLVTKSKSFSWGCPDITYICLDTINKANGKQVKEEQKERGEIHWAIGRMIIKELKK